MKATLHPHHDKPGVQHRLWINVSPAWKTVACFWGEDGKWFGDARYLKVDVQNLMPEVWERICIDKKRNL